MTESFQQMPLGEILTRVERFEKRNDLEEYHFAGTYSFARGIFIGETKLGSTFRLGKIQRIHQGDFVYCKIMAWEGAFGLVPAEAHNCVMSGAFVVYEIDQTRIDPDYLRFYFMIPRVWKSIGAQSTGTNVRRRSLHPNQFESSMIPLPPLAEQRRIVARIEKLAARIDEARRLKNQTIKVVSSLTASAISTIFSEGVEKGWPMGQLGDYVTDDRYGTSERTTYDASGIPILRMGNIQDGRLDLRDLKYLHLDGKDQTKLLLAKGDILVNRTNSAELVGKCAVFDLNRKCGFASYLVRLRLDERRAEPRLVASYINSPAGRKYMFDERKQMTGQANVNAKKLKALPIALPRLSEQRRIISFLDDLQVKVDELRRVQSGTAGELDAMLPAILDKAFKGEL